MGTTATVFILRAYGMKIQRLKREKERVRDMARKLGEYAMNTKATTWLTMFTCLFVE